MSEMLTYEFLRRGFLQGFLWDGNGDGGSGTGTGTGDPDPARTAKGDPPPATPPTDPPASTEDQFTNLRSALDSERNQRKTLEKELKELKRDKLPEGERLQAENEELKGTVSSLTKKLTELTVGNKITSTARGLNFKHPEKAMKALQLFTEVDISTLDTDDKVKKALEDLAKAEQDLVTTPPPSGGPIVPSNGQTPSGNAGFNQEIRRRAGRA